MQINKTIIDFTLISLVFVASCSKDRLPEAGGTSLSKVYIRNGNRDIIFSSEYSYNAQNKLSGIVSKNNLALEGDKEVFSYDPLGRYIAYSLTNDLTGDVILYEFEYSSTDLINRSKSTPAQANLAQGDFIFAYDPKGRIIADSIVARNSSYVTFYHTYSYDERDNVSEYQVYRRFGNDFQLYQKTNYTYDDKLNPYYASGLLLFYTGKASARLLSKNNVLSSNTNGNMTPADFYEYTYYSNDLIRASRENFANNGQITEYFYQ